MLAVLLVHRFDEEPRAGGIQRVEHGVHRVLEEPGAIGVARGRGSILPTHGAHFPLAGGCRPRGVASQNAPLAGSRLDCNHGEDLRPAIRRHLVPLVNHKALAGSEDPHAEIGPLARDLAADEAARIGAFVHQPDAHIETPGLLHREPDPLEIGR